MLGLSANSFRASVNTGIEKVGDGLIFPANGEDFGFEAAALADGTGHEGRRRGIASPRVRSQGLGSDHIYLHHC